MAISLMFILLLLVGCAENEEENETGEQSDDELNESIESNGEDENEEGSVDVDKGLLSVEITLPASMFEGEEIDMAEAEEDGMNITQNDNGSVTYKMSKAKHREMMNEMESGVIQSVEEMKASEDYLSIKDITYNNSFTEFTLVVDKEAYENSMDGFAVFGLGMSGMFYQLYDGVDTDDSKTTIFVKDEATEEIFDEIVYPDDMGE